MSICPKNKSSKGRRDRRRANWKMSAPNLVKCSKCGEEILFSNYQRYIKNIKKHDVCQDCFEYGNKIYSTVRCSDCGRSFEITNRQYDFYRSKGLNLPKRCDQCRKNKKSYSNTTSSSKTTIFSTLRSNKAKCFITTAVCEYFNKADDCYELTNLRQFRDEWLSCQPEGKELIIEYYDIAPIIVKNLEILPAKDTIYNELWNNYISLCLKHIENNEYQRCKELYISMVSYLKKKFNL